MADLGFPPAIFEFHLDENQTRYVRFGISLGVFAGHVYPELIDEGIAKPEIAKTKSVTK